VGPYRPSRHCDKTQTLTRADEPFVELRRERLLSLREPSQRVLSVSSVTAVFRGPAGGRVGIGWSEALATWPALSSSAGFISCSICQAEDTLGGDCFNFLSNSVSSRKLSKVESLKSAVCEFLFLHLKFLSRAPFFVSLARPNLRQASLCLLHETVNSTFDSLRRHLEQDASNPIVHKVRSDFKNSLGPRLDTFGIPIGQPKRAS